MTATQASPYITCRQLIDFIADYLDGTLALDQRFEFERHLSVCPSCVAYLDGYRKVVALGRATAAANDDPATGAFPEGLVQAVRAARKKL
jgi:anti-sigma factor RsiW